MKTFSKDIMKYLTSNKYDFKLFKMNYSIKETLCIDNFNLDCDRTYSHFGSITMMKGLYEFISEIGNNNITQIETMTKIITNIIKKVLKGYDMEYFWMDIRISTPNELYKIPRWHKDGYFFNNTELVAKFATVLKGPGTLVIRGTKETNSTYKMLVQKMRDDKSKYDTDKDKEKFHNKYRKIYMKAFNKYKMKQLDNNTGIIFYNGIEKGAIHSEPPINENRMFISILPGSMNDIMALKERRK